MERETNGADAQETTEKNEQERFEENVEATAQAVFEEAAKAAEAAEAAAKAAEVDELEKVKAERDEARALAVVALYRALGGDWDAPSTESVEEAAPENGSEAASEAK